MAIGIAQTGVDELSLAGDDRGEYIWVQEAMEEAVSLLKPRLCHYI
jgi:SpoU rRNA methylase family enzyme